MTQAANSPIEARDEQVLQANAMKDLLIGELGRGEGSVDGVGPRTASEVLDTLGSAFHSVWCWWIRQHLASLPQLESGGLHVTTEAANDLIRRMDSHYVDLRDEERELLRDLVAREFVARFLNLDEGVDYSGIPEGDEDASSE